MQAKTPLLIMSLLILGLGGHAHAAPAISVLGDWPLTLGSADLSAGAGSGFRTEYESRRDAAIICITNTLPGLGSWRIDARRNDASWPAGLTVCVRRVTDGSGPGLIAGGTTYQAISTTNTTFFSGTGDRTSIEIQLKLSGLPTLFPAGTYSTAIVYTVVTLQ